MTFDHRSTMRGGTKKLTQVNTDEDEISVEKQKMNRVRKKSHKNLLLRLNIVLMIQ